MPKWFRARGYVYSHSVSKDSHPVERSTQECRTFPINIDLDEISSYCRICRSFEWHNNLADVGGTEVVMKNGLAFYLSIRYDRFCELMDKYYSSPIEESYLKDGDEG